MSHPHPGPLPEGEGVCFVADRIFIYLCEFVKGKGLFREWGFGGRMGVEAAGRSRLRGVVPGVEESPSFTGQDAR